MNKKFSGLVLFVLLVGLANSAWAYNWKTGNENVIPYTQFSLSYNPPGELDGSRLQADGDNLWEQVNDGLGKHPGPYLMQRNSEVLTGTNVLTLTLADNLPSGRYVVALEDLRMHGGQNGGGGEYFVAATIEGVDANSENWNERYNDTIVRLFLGDGSFVQTGQTYDVYSEPSFLVTDGSINIELGTAYTNGSYPGCWFSFSGLAISRISGPDEPGVAWRPEPVDGATIETRNLALGWKAGAYAASYDVYFGTDFDDVSNAANPLSLPGRGNQTAATYTPETLELGTTYYWRIDVHDSVNTHKGDIWRFKVINNTVVDDFESYHSRANNSLKQVWSEQRNDLALEAEAVHEDSFSMAVRYSNQNPPYYTEAIRTYANGQDWTAAGVEVLSLFFHGKVSNTAQRMYVALEDTAGHVATVPYNGDVDNLKNEWWQLWKINLQDFGRVNLAGIKKIYIGFGDKDNQSSPGGSGIVYFDDIRLYPLRYVPSYLPPAQEPGPALLFKLARSYDKNEYHQQAERLYKMLIANYSGTDRAFNSRRYLAILYVGLEDDAAAQVQTDRLIANFSDHPGLPRVVFLIAEEYYTRAFRKRNEGLDEQANNSFLKAVTVWERIINELPSSVFTPQAYYYSACGYRQVGEYEKAIEYCREVVDNWPGYKYVWHAQFMIGRCYEKLGQQGSLSAAQANPKIRQAYQKLLEICPTCKVSEIAQAWLDSAVNN